MSYRLNICRKTVYIWVRDWIASKGFIAHLQVLLYLSDRLMNWLLWSHHLDAKHSKYGPNVSFLQWHLSTRFWFIYHLHYPQVTKQLVFCLKLPFGPHTDSQPPTLSRTASLFRGLHPFHSTPRWTQSLPLLAGAVRGSLLSCSWFWAEVLGEQPAQPRNDRTGPAAAAGSCTSASTNCFSQGFLVYAYGLPAGPALSPALRFVNFCSFL